MFVGELEQPRRVVEDSCRGDQQGGTVEQSSEKFLLKEVERGDRKLHHHVGSPDAEFMLECIGEVHHIGLTDHNAVRPAGAAGGKNHIGRSVGMYGYRSRSAPGVGLGHALRSQRFQSRRDSNGAEPGETMAIGIRRGYKIHTRLAHHMPYALRRQAGLCGHIGRTGAEHRQYRCHQLHSVGHHDAHDSRAFIRETCLNGGCQRVEAAVAHRLRGRAQRRSLRLTLNHLLKPAVDTCHNVSPFRGAAVGPPRF